MVIFQLFPFVHNSIWLPVVDAVLLAILSTPLFYVFAIKEFVKKVDDGNYRLAQLKQAIDHHSIISITDDTGVIVDVNERFLHISGYTKEELLGHNHCLVNSGYHDNQFWYEFYSCLKKGQAWRGEIKNRRKNGSYYWVNSTVIPFFDSQGYLENYISVRTDITDIKLAKEKLKRANIELQTKAYTDSLSGVANRLGIEEYLYRVLNRSESKAVLLLDIDKFKMINDMHGHLVGDELIKCVAINIKRSVRKDMDFVGRYGGDEFIIILSRVDKYTSVRVAENIREKISSISVPDIVSPAISRVTCSVGVVSFLGVSDKETVVSLADSALYQAKKDGRNCVRSKSLNG